MTQATIRNVIISLVLIMSSAIMFGFMFYKVTAQGVQLSAQIEVLEKEQAREDSYSKLERISNETIEDRERLSSYFLSREGDSIDFLSQVETLAPTAGVFLQTENLDLIIDKADGTKWIKVDFSFSGSRERVQQFIELLEEMPYVLRITGIEMSARSSTEWYASLTMQVRVLAYDE